MEKNFYIRIASLTDFDAMQLEKLTLEELVQNVILPDICLKDPRCISKEFIMFMAEFGFDIYKQNNFHGEALYDMALQALFQDGCFFALPDIYREACINIDRAYGLQPIGKTELTFLKAQASHILSRKGTSGLLFLHMEKILFELLENISPEGRLLKNGLCKDGLTPLELRNFAEEIASTRLGFYKIYTQLATPDKWKVWPRFFIDHEKEINWKDFATRIGFNSLFRRGQKSKMMLQEYINKKGSV